MDSPFMFMLVFSVGVMCTSALTLVLVPERYMFVVERVFVSALVMFLGWVALVLAILFLSF